MLISCFRSYKYKISRKALETMYKSFILPHFDYADIVWDNCTHIQSKMLENQPLESIRIITGGILATRNLYEESGFCTLKERRKRRKLLMFHKMILGLRPQYINDLLPPLVAYINSYHRRRPLQRNVTTYKTELYRNSFIPSTTAEWKSLPINVQQSTYLRVFKRALPLSDSKVPAYYYFGERSAQVIHCRLHLEMSNHNNDLVNCHLSTDPKCFCGYSRETTEHYLLHCPNYLNIRAKIILTLPSNQTNIRTLLYGNLDLRLPENKHIFLTVHEFIKLSKRL